MCCSVYPCSHWLLLSGSLTGDQTCTLGVLGDAPYNPLSYLARAGWFDFQTFSFDNCRLPEEVQEQTNEFLYVHSLP